MPYFSKITLVCWLFNDDLRMTSSLSKLCYTCLFAVAKVYFPLDNHCAIYFPHYNYLTYISSAYDIQDAFSQYLYVFLFNMFVDIDCNCPFCSLFQLEKIKSEDQLQKEITQLKELMATVV